MYQTLGVSLTADADGAGVSLDMETEYHGFRSIISIHLGTDGILIVMLTLLRVDTLPVQLRG